MKLHLPRRRYGNFTTIPLIVVPGSSVSLAPFTPLFSQRIATCCQQNRTHPSLPQYYPSTLTNSLSYLHPRSCHIPHVQHTPGFLVPLLSSFRYSATSQVSHPVAHASRLPTGPFRSRVPHSRSLTPRKLYIQNTKQRFHVKLTLSTLP